MAKTRSKFGPEDKAAILRTSYYVICFGLVLFSLLFRFYFVNYTEVDRPIRADAASYHICARNLLKYGIYSQDHANVPPVPDSYRSPGYPFYLAAVMAMSHSLGVNDYPVIIISQVFLGAFTVLFTILVGRLFLGRMGSLFAAGLACLSPHLISMANVVLTETLSCFLLLLSIYIFCLTVRRKSVLLSGAAGVTIGAGYLVNQVFLFLPIFFVLAFAFTKVEHSTRKAGMKLMAPFLVCFFVVYAGWELRGYMNVDRGASSSSERLTINFIIGSHYDFFDIYRADTRDPNNPATVDIQSLRGLRGGVTMSNFLPIWVERVFERPGHYASWYFLEKPVLFWSWDILVGSGDVYVYPVKSSFYSSSALASLTHALMKFFHFWFVVFAVLGCVFLRRKTSSELFIPLVMYLTLLYVSGVYVATQAEPRYSIPLRPELYLCVAFSVSEFISWSKQKIKRSPEAGG